ncbi:hypothetical protein ACGFW5_19380 [Streptomyces sp. NPDC048416]|uniref:hypothetical protein n=1 Tax=Streptomyces sp. NPDC048416 TaxID=3365546 RepID=UPI003711B3F2
MHRTRNALNLLTAVAALAVCGCAAGCVSVDAGPAPSRSAVPPARRQGLVAPQVVQAPAREALEAVAPTDSSAPAPAPPPSAGRPTADRPTADHPAVARHDHRHRVEQPGHRHLPAAPDRPRHRPAPAPPALGGLCALGQDYGGWRPDSPEARICRATYGP